jgi:hypothetical protein
MNEEIKDVNPLAEEIQNLEAQIANIDVTQLNPEDNGKTLEIQQETVETNEETQVETESKEDPIKVELERVKGQTQGKSQKEKFEYKLKTQIAQAKEMGINVAEIVGAKTESEEIDDEKPLTRRDLESILKANTQSKKATEMALEIENEAERELYLHYLDNKVNPNLSEEEKFQTAKDMVNGIKLKNQISLSNIKPQSNTHSSASSVVPNKQQNFDNHRLTREEELFFNDAKIRGIPLSKEEIVQMRSK